MQKVRNGEAVTSPDPTDVAALDILPYERLDSKALMSAVQLRPGEQLLVLRPFGWHLNGKHIPNAAEHFSRDSVCNELHLSIVCDYGPYIAVVRPMTDPDVAALIQRAQPTLRNAGTK